MVILAPFGYFALQQPPPATCGSMAELGWETAAWILFLSGTALRFWATLYIGGNKGNHVVSEGPYSICRNPLYLGTLLITLSVAAFLESSVFAVGAALAAAVYLATTVRWEEKKLRARFGRQFDEYCRRVPRFLPRFSGLQTRPFVTFDVRCLKIEAVRAIRWAAIPLVVHLILFARLSLH